MREVSSQMKQLDELIETYNSLLKSNETMFWDQMEELGINEEILKDFARNGFVENSSQFNIPAIDEVFKTYGSTTEKIKERFYYEKDQTITYYEYCTKLLIEAIKQREELERAKEELKKTTDDKENLLKNYVAALKSPQYRAARIKQIEDMKERVKSADITDDERRTLERKLSIIEKSQNLSFITERLHKLGDKERKSIQTAYFDTTRGTYVMERYTKVLQRLGVNPNIHGAFFDIEEENFKDIYREYNNLFLFHIVRMIAYSDINNEEDYLYISCLLGTLKNIVTNEATDEEKTNFFNIIKEFYTFFDTDENKKYFREHNHAYKFHPERIEMEKQMHIAKRNKTIENIKMELGTLIDDTIRSNLSDENFDVDNYFNSIISEKLEMMEKLNNYQEECAKNKKDCFFDMKDIHTYEEVKDHYSELLIELETLKIVEGDYLVNDDENRKAGEDAEEVKEFEHKVETSDTGKNTEETDDELQ